ncbi:MAG: NusG domain II-containing protein [Candidatus Bipolaricaulia bacterium]
MGPLRYLKWGDWLLITGVIAASLVFIPLLHSAARGRVALVRVGDTVVRELALNREQRLVVAGRLGETEIEVRDGRVRVVRSPGPWKLCIRRGWISRPGEALICLPNRVTVEIPGEAGYDALVR